MNLVIRLVALTFFLAGCSWMTADVVAQEKAGDQAAETKQADSADKKAADKGEAKEEAGKKKAEPKKKQPPKIKPLHIGSAAPQLDIEHWIQDGKGHFAKVSEFEADKVYVVEFWATWCGPCIASMPHIAEIQEKYADHGVQVISITREDAETVEEFLDRKIRGAEDSDDENAPKTYRELTSGYCLTADPDNSSSNDYMRAAKQNGIPCAFIVGKDSKIEWIGHPMSMDEPLEQIVSNSWDRDAFAVTFAEEQEADELMSSVYRLMRSRKTKEAVAALDEYLEGGKLESQHGKFKAYKFRFLISDKTMSEEAFAYATELFDDKSLDPQMVNSVAWQLYQMAAAKRIDNEDVLRAALRASNRAVDDAGPGRAYLLDTISHLKYELGNVKGALKSQRAAMAAASDGQKARLKDFLAKLEKEVAEADQPKKKAEGKKKAAAEKKAEGKKKTDADKESKSDE